MAEYITVKQAMVITDLAHNTLSLAAQRNEIRGYKERGKWLLSKEDVLALKKTPKKFSTRKKQEKDSEQVTIFDFIPDVSRVPKHARKDQEKEWKEPRFTYEDLLHQYNRGYQRGLEEGKNQC